MKFLPTPLLLSCTMDSAIIFLIAMTHAVIASDTDATAINPRLCGPLSLACVLRSIGADVPIDQIVREMPRGGSDATFEELRLFAKSAGFECVAVHWRILPKINERTAPAIIPLGQPGKSRHFVALLAAIDGRVRIHDFPNSPKWISEGVLRDQWHWDGTALHVSTDQEQLRVLTSVPSFMSRFGLMGTGCLVLAGLVLSLRTKRLVPPRTADRSGFSLIDVLVVLAIISLLISLLMPAVQRSREAARRLSCQSNQRQLGLAIANFEATRNHLPNVDQLPNGLVSGGFPDSSDISVQTLLLPYLDQAPLFQQIKLDDYLLVYSKMGVNSTLNNAVLKIPVPVFQCPSDNVPPGGCSYPLSCGTSPGLHGNLDLPSDEAARAGYIGRLTGQFGSFTDGLSQTVILSERSIGDMNLTTYTPSRDEAFYGQFNGFSAGTAARSCGNVPNPPSDHFSFTGTCWLATGYGYTWYNHVLTPNSRTPDCSDSQVLGNNSLGCHSARSTHTGGVNATFGDGSVRFINEEIDLKVWRAMGTSQGNEIVSGGTP